MNSTRHLKRWNKSRTILIALTIVLSLMLFLNFLALTNQNNKNTQIQHEEVKRKEIIHNQPVFVPKEPQPQEVQEKEEKREEEEEEQAEKITTHTNIEQDTNTNRIVNIPIIVVACKRASYLQRALDSLLKYLPKEPIGGVQFSIIVSRDCKSPEVEELLGSSKYGLQVSNMRFVPQSEVRSMNDGYSAIARHYKWIFTQAFDVLHYDAAVIVEEDMEISPDFYEYFAAGYKLLNQDPTLWCISSWNDNGLSSLVSDPYALYRSDFFPGLGWMLLSSLWKDDLSDKWPTIYWDDHIRRSDIRKDRVCIRPEFSRTFNFGESGVSNGQFYSTHLKHISSNKLDIKWSQMDLASKYTKENYDKKFISDLKNARLVKDWTEIYNSKPREEGEEEEEVVIPYTVSGFPSIARKFGLMEDFKDGVARTAYMGVVTFKWKAYKVNLVPQDFLSKIGK